jgi:hypothetical protein
MLRALTAWLFRPRPPRRPIPFRPRLEALEDRRLPSATILSGLPAATPLAGRTSRPSAAVATTLTLDSSVLQPEYGQKVVFTATLTPPSSGSVTTSGVVRFMDGTTVLGSGTLKRVSGVLEAVWATRKLAVGNHTITASYAGEGSFGPSSAGPLTETVGQTNTRLQLTSSAPVIITGEQVTFTATVAAVAPGAGTPTGLVSFYDNERLIGSGRLRVVGGFIQATCTTASLHTGSHYISATYPGDGDFAPSSGVLVGGPYDKPIVLKVDADPRPGGARPVFGMLPFRFEL